MFATFATKGHCRDPASIRIPSAPAGALSCTLMLKDEPDIDAVASTIARDPGLSAHGAEPLDSLFGLRNKIIADSPGDRSCCSAC